MTLETVFDCAAGIATALLLYTGFTSSLSAASAAQLEPRTIDITAKRFEFEPSHIDIDEGETVRLIVRSADGMHGLSIKKLKVAEDIPRGGDPVTIEFTATAPGEYEILCTEYCGKGHSAMRGLLVVRARSTKGAPR